jgi:hypothetical protein
VSAKEPRESPSARVVALLVAFVALLVVAVFTVVLPEIEDEPDPEVGGTAGAADAGVSAASPDPIFRP